MRLSIIIPAYNAEGFIEKCIDSIIDNNFNAYEIIVIDDGSTDKTPEILDRMAIQYCCMRVFHVNNGGVSEARNLGIEKAQGEYLAFVDADDFVEEGYVSKLLSYISQNVDLVLFNYERWLSADKHETGRLQLSEGRHDCRNDLFNEACGLEVVCLSVCLALYKRKIIEDNNLRFDKSMKTCEDFMFSLRYYLYVKSFFVSHETLYYYRLNESSVTSRRSVQHAYDYAKVYDSMVTMMKRERIDETHKMTFNERWSRWIVSLIANYKMQGMKSKEIYSIVYCQPYFIPTTKMKGRGVRFFIDHFLLKHRLSTICYLYLGLLSSVKKLFGSYKL